MAKVEVAKAVERMVSRVGGGGGERDRESRATLRINIPKLTHDVYKRRACANNTHGNSSKLTSAPALSTSLAPLSLARNARQAPLGINPLKGSSREKVRVKLASNNHTIGERTKRARHNIGAVGSRAIQRESEAKASTITTKVASISGRRKGSLSKEHTKHEDSERKLENEEVKVSEDTVETRTHLGADYTRTHFDTKAPFEDFEGMQSDFPWVELGLKHMDAEFDLHKLRELESKTARGASLFAKELRRLLLDRGGEQIMRSAWKLPTLLNTLSLDRDEPLGAWVYVTISRGVELLPDGIEVEATHLDNYRSASEDHRDKVDGDVQRQLGLRFVGKWTEVRKEYNIKELEPTVVLPLGAVLRKGKIRIVFDPSRELEGTRSSLNDLQVVPGNTCLASINLLLAAMSKSGSFWKADLSAAFSQTPLAAKSIKFCTFLWQAPGDSSPTLYAFRRLGFGFKIGCFVQQCIAVAISRALMRRVTKLGLKCGRWPEFCKPQPKNYPAERQHERRAFKAGKGRRRARAKGERVKRAGNTELTALLSYLDDFGGASNEGTLTGPTRAGDFTFLHFLSLCREIGCVVATQPGKSEPPTRDAMIYLGFEVVCNKLCVRLDKERITSMVELMDGLMKRSSITIKEMLSLIGLLVFAAIVIPGARFAYSGLLDKVRGLRGRDTKTRLVEVDDIFVRDCEMYKELMERMNGVNAIQGARRPCVRWEMYSDASFLGYCYWSEAGHYKDGRWPAPWLESRIGLLTKYKDIFICELEAWGVLFMCRHLVPLCASSVVHLHCDNAPVVAMLRRHTARSSRCAPIIREIEFLTALYDCEICAHHVRTYDNTLADLGTRQFESDFKLDKLTKAKAAMRVAAKRRFPSKPRRCEMVRPDIRDLYHKYTAKMDVWSAPLSREEEKELELLLPFYLKPKGASALVKSK